MENASKALVMAGGVLIGILILSLAVYLFVDFGTTSAEINKQKAGQQIVQFNSKFTSYEGLKDDAGNWKITIYDIITVIGYAKENNDYYEDNFDNYGIKVFIDGREVQNYSEDDKLSMIKNDQENLDRNNSELPKYSCKVTQYHNNGRIQEITFRKL